MYIHETANGLTCLKLRAYEGHGGRLRLQSQALPPDALRDENPKGVCLLPPLPRPSFKNEQLPQSHSHTSIGGFPSPNSEGNQQSQKMIEGKK